MATLQAVGPILAHNESLGKDVELPLVSFSKHSVMAVTINGSTVNMPWVAEKLLYKVTHNGHTYRSEGPKFVAVP